MLTSREKRPVRTVANVLISICIVAAALAVGRYFFVNPPEEKKVNSPRRTVISVETMILQPQDYQVKIKTFGTVQAGRKASVVSQVKGMVVDSGENMQTGAFFDQGELLYSIDDRDYTANMKITEAGLIEARARLEEEKARSEQAESNWKRLGDGAAGSDLVLRKPYLASARAAVLSAEARHEQARLDLERCRIVAPYDGRVLVKNVDSGQFISAGTSLAEIYATSYFEIRAPLNSRQQNLVVIHDEQNGEKWPAADSGVEIVSGQGAQEVRWQGKLSRTEGAVDARNQQLYVIVRLDDPFEQAGTSGAQLKIGQFVRLYINGKTFTEVFLIPSHTLYANSEVIILKEEHLERRQVSVISKDEKYAIIDSGLSDGEELVVSPLGSVVTGTRATRTGDGRRGR